MNAVRALRPGAYSSFRVMSATLMQVLDTTIVNVALPHMQGQLNANSDQISWVLTSYLVSSAIFMPLTGYFADTLGHKRLLLLCIGGFVVASALCGIAQNVTEIVGFRLLQGVFGAGLSPLSQAIMSDAYPPEERGKAMAIWGMGVMVGPVLGPTLGGWLTDVASWRWAFYINVPVGILSLVLAARFVPDTARKTRRMDWPGLLYLACGVAGVQYVFDRGTQQDWFAATDIRVAAVLGIIGILAFVEHSLRLGTKAIFDVRIFSDWNFLTACLIIMALGVGMYGSMVLQPILLESLLGYPIMTTGIVMAPRGVFSAISMFLAGRLVGKVDARVLVSGGMLCGAFGSWAMSWYSLEIDTWWLIWPACVQGMGLGFMFVPLSTIAYATLARSRMAEAAGIYSLLRTLGSALGISIVTSVLSHQRQVLWNELGAHITPFNPAVSRYLGPLHLTTADPSAMALIAQQVGQQAQIGAIIDVFMLTTVSFVVMLPLVMLLRSSRHSAPPLDAKAPADPQFATAAH